MIKTSTILRKAKKNLWDGVSKLTYSSTKFICCAIQQGKPLPLTHKARRVIKRIENDLDASCVERWLFRHGYLVPGPSTKKERMKIQQYRHAWLDSLIAEYEAKGD